MAPRGSPSPSWPETQCRIAPKKHLHQHDRPSPSWRPGSLRRPHGRIPCVVDSRRGTVAIMASHYHHGAQGVSVAFMVGYLFHRHHHGANHVFNLSSMFRCSTVRARAHFDRSLPVALTELRVFLYPQSNRKWSPAEGLVHAGMHGDRINRLFKLLRSFSITHSQTSQRSAHLLVCSVQVSTICQI